MDSLCADNSPIIITRNRDQAVVMLSLEDYESLEEIACLLRSPANARRLKQAIDDLDNGKGFSKVIGDFERRFFSRLKRGKVIGPDELLMSIGSYGGQKITA